MGVFHKQQVIFLLAVLLFSGILFAQQVTLAGKVLDEKLVPVENTTVYTKPLGYDENLVFSITDANGNYKLKLSNDKFYLLTISHLGYKEITDTIILKEDITRDYILEESIQSLDEIILRRKLAIEVKKDTITYQADRFTNGNERKLRDVLDKLPGMEVDREGNVKVNGKDVTTLCTSLI